MTALTATTRIVKIQSAKTVQTLFLISIPAMLYQEDLFFIIEDFRVSQIEAQEL